MSEAKRIGTIHKVKIDDILIGDRFRVEMGDLENLALSMQIKGQLEPIIVDIGPAGKYNLIEGERRIRAAEINNWTHIECMQLESLSKADRMELELITCIHKRGLSWMEEAIGVRKIVEERRREAQQGSLARMATSVKNKDVAIELNMTESRMSENLRIAEAVEDHPELEAECLTRSAFLKKIRRQDFFVPKGSILQQTYEENFIVANPLSTIETVEDKIVNLAILHPDHIDVELLDKVIARLATHGQILLFSTHKETREWEDLMRERGLGVGAQPYIWAIKNSGTYQNYLWAGMNRTSPLRPIPSLFSAARPTSHLHLKGKPFTLVSQLVKSTTERGDFVLVPECFDIETVRCCVEIGRNIRAGQVNKILRDKLIMSIVKNERK